LTKGLELAEKTGEFIIEQAPELLKEFYAWHIAEDMLYIFIGLLVFVIVILLYKKAEWDNGPNFINLSFVAVVTMSIFTTGIMIVHMFDLVKILIAPKLYLIEYFAN